MQSLPLTTQKPRGIGPRLLAKVLNQAPVLDGTIRAVHHPPVLGA